MVRRGRQAKTHHPLAETRQYRRQSSDNPSRGRVERGVEPAPVGARGRPRRDRRGRGRGAWHRAPARQVPAVPGDGARRPNDSAHPYHRRTTRVVGGRLRYSGQRRGQGAGANNGRTKRSDKGSNPLSYKDIPKFTGRRLWRSRLVSVAGLMSRPIELARAYEDLVKIGIALTSERDLATLLERILTEARRFTHADAGTLFLREADQLVFAIVQNETMVRDMGEDQMKAVLQAEPLPLNELSLAGYVAMTGDILNLHDSYSVPPDRPYAHNRSVDARTSYRTESILVVPLQDMSGKILGVLELINALDGQGRVIPFDPQFEGL